MAETTIHSDCILSSHDLSNSLYYSAKYEFGSSLTVNQTQKVSKQKTAGLKPAVFCGVP